MLTFEKLRGSEMLERYRDQQESYSQVPYIQHDDFVDKPWDKTPYEAHNLYIVAFEGTTPVGAIKFWADLPKRKEHLNSFLASEGIPEIQGRMFHGAYVGVHPEYRRRGIGAQLNNLLAKELRPGDVFVFSSHEEEGARLNAQWFSRMGGEINVIFAENYWGYRDYDPSKKNFVVTDPDQFRRSLQRIVAAWWRRS